MDAEPDVCVRKGDKGREGERREKEGSCSVILLLKTS